MEFTDSKPIYLQIAEQIMDETTRNDFMPESRLLSVRDYAAKVGVNPNTVMRAYNWLQEEKIISNRRGVGYFYTPSAHKIVRMKLQDVFLDRELPETIKKMIRLGLSPDYFDRFFRKLRDEYLRKEWE